MFKAPLDEARKCQTEPAWFASHGFGMVVYSQAVQFAKGMQAVGTRVLDNMTLQSDAMGVFKDLRHAEIAAPLMAKR